MNDRSAIELDSRIEIEQQVRPREDLKEIINGMLFTTLPPACTLAEADAIACRIFSAINESWSAHRKAAKEVPK